MFGNRITLFRIAGFKIQADYSWLIIAFLITWSLATGLFPAYYQNLPPGSYWIMGIIGAIGLFGGIVFHEISHSLVARRFGMPIKEITLWIFGGVAHMEEEPPTPKAEFLMAIAGPLSSIAIGFIFFGLELLSRTGGAPKSIEAIFWYLFRINIILGIFNLVPAFPLDGGRVLRAALWKGKNDLLGATRISSIIGSGFGFLLAGFGFFFMFQGDFLGGIWWIVIGFFLNSASRNSYRRLRMVRALSGIPVKKFMKQDAVSVTETLPISELVEDYVYTHHYKMFPVTDPNGELSGCITTADIKSIPKEQWDRTNVRDLAHSCSEENTVHPDMDASEALTLMQRTGNSRLMVTRDGELLGIVTLKDLLNYLSMKFDLEK